MTLQDTADISGIIDAHVHIRSPEAFVQIATAGIVAARDAGIRENSAPGHEIRNLAGRLVVVSSGWALYKKGGYGSSLGVPVEGRDEIAAEIQRLAQAGAGIIKVIASGIVSLREPGKITAGGFTGDDLAYIVDEAARRGLGVMAHANGEHAIMASAEAGVRSVEHGFFMTVQALEVMAKRGTFWTPTTGALARAAVTGRTSNGMKASIRGLIASHLTMIRHAHAIGVPLAVGTDCVLPDIRYREVYRAELKYFEQTGISRAKVLQIACEGGARLLGI